MSERTKKVVWSRSWFAISVQLWGQRCDYPRYKIRWGGGGGRENKGSREAEEGCKAYDVRGRGRDSGGKTEMNRWGWQSPGSLVDLRVSCLIRADRQSHRWVWSSLEFSLIHSSEGKFWCWLEKMLNQIWEMPKCTVIKAAEAPSCSSHPGVSQSMAARSFVWSQRRKWKGAKEKFVPTDGLSVVGSWRSAVLSSWIQLVWPTQRSARLLPFS